MERYYEIFSWIALIITCSGWLVFLAVIAWGVGVFEKEKWQSGQPKTEA